MLNVIDIHSLLTDSGRTAPKMSGCNRFEAKRQSGYVPALAERCAR